MEAATGSSAEASEAKRTQRLLYLFQVRTSHTHCFVLAFTLLSLCHSSLIHSFTLSLTLSHSLALSRTLSHSLIVLLVTYRVKSSLSLFLSLLSLTFLISFVLSLTYRAASLSHSHFSYRSHITFYILHVSHIAHPTG